MYLTIIATTAARATTAAARNAADFAAAC